MDPSRLNLSLLDPSVDEDRWERLIASIGERAEPILARHRAAVSPLLLLSTWVRPALAAAAVIALVCTLAVRAFDGPGIAQFDAEPAAERIGDLTTKWITDDRTPTTEEILTVLEGEGL